MIDWTVEKRGWIWSAPDGWRIRRYVGKDGTLFLLYRGSRLVTGRTTLTRIKEAAESTTR